MAQKSSGSSCVRLAQKAVTSLENCLQYNIEFSQRHCHSLEEFLRDSVEGFYATDARYINRLFELLAENYRRTEIFRRYLLKMLQISAIPLLLHTTSDSVKYRRDIAEYFSMFGDVMLMTLDQEVLELITAALESIFLLKQPFLCCIPKAVCNNILLISRLPTTLVSLMNMTTGSLFRKLLSATYAVIQSDDICRVFLEGNIVNVILTNIGRDDVNETDNADSDICPDDMYLSLTVLSYLVLKTRQDRHYGRIDICLEDESWRNCHAVFRKIVLMQGQKALRNFYFTTVLNVFLTTMHADKCAHFPKYFLIDCAMLFSTSEVQCVDHTWAKDFFYTSDLTDFHFKNLLMAAMLIFAKLYDTVQCLRSTGVFLSLFRIIDPDFKVIWTAGQRITLSSKTVVVLNKFMRFYVDVFEELNGPSRLLEVLKLCIAGNYQRNLILPLLRCIFGSITFDATGNLVEMYRNNGSYLILIELAITLIQLPMITIHDQQTLTMAFFILEKLNTDCSLRINRILHLIFSCLQRYLTPEPQDIIFSHNIIISVISLLWMCLIDCDGAKSRFIQRGGVYLLLDVLQKVSHPVKIVILGLALDLISTCEDAIPCFLTWRGTNDRYLIHILLDTFKEECRLIGAKYDGNGIMQDVERPLMGERQYKLYQKSDWRSSPSILDMLASTRPKIYGILTIINCLGNHVDPTMETYKLQPHLSLFHQITKLVAENYLQLKIGEVWQEVFRDLTLDDATTACFEKTVLGYCTTRFLMWAANVQTGQLSLMDEVRNQSARLEKSVYRCLRESSLAESLDALAELTYHAYGCEHIFRLTGKVKQERQLKTSRAVQEQRNSKFHETFLYNVYVSKVFNQSVDVKSNVVIKPLKRLSNISVNLVSPIDSTIKLEGGKQYSLNSSLFMGPFSSEEMNVESSSSSEETIL